MMPCSDLDDLKYKLKLVSTLQLSSFKCIADVLAAKQAPFQPFHTTTVAQKGQTQNNLPKHKTIYQNTKQFTKTRNNLPKHKTIYQITNQFTKSQINLPKHKTILQNKINFPKTQISLPKHKPISQNTNQFPESQIKRLGTCSMIIRESLEGTHSQDFPRPTWRLL